MPGKGQSHKSKPTARRTRIIISQSLLLCFTIGTSVSTHCFSHSLPARLPPIDSARGPLGSRTLASLQLGPDNTYLATNTSLTTHITERLFSHSQYRLRNNPKDRPAYITRPEKSSPLHPSLQWQLPMRGQRRQAAPTRMRLPSCRGAAMWKARHRAQLQKVR